MVSCHKRREWAFERGSGGVAETFTTHHRLPTILRHLTISGTTGLVTANRL